MKTPGDILLRDMYAVYKRKAIKNGQTPASFKLWKKDIKAGVKEYYGR